MNYITNLFAVAVGDSRFLDPVFGCEEMLCFLSGRLPAADNVTISDHQRAIAERVLGPQMHTLMSTAT